MPQQLSTLGNSALIQASNKNEVDLSPTVKWVAAGIGAGVLLLLGGRWVYKATVRKNFFDNSDDPERAEHYLKQFEAAFYPDTPFGLGTDEELLRDIVVAVPHKKMWGEIKRKWRMVHSSSLMDAIAGEVSRYMQSEIDAIIRQRPRNKREAEQRPAGYFNDEILDAHAERVNAATKYEWWPPFIGGTDTPAIYAVLHELGSFQALCRLNWIYQRKYGITMMDHLWDELTWGEIDQVQKIIKEDYPDARNKEIHELFYQCSRPQDL